ncbi:Hypothetical predicted protein [Olea europaea subsp. europaea]|uniref:FAF domain-containing protein n=1 Tax=Olea europaea subsp. europaea TaxID=158383 RepID=A0A8S0PE20_OLEEU|nr:Hypothetical predicted protein [Olea europaea subsp. europaea]
MQNSELGDYIGAESCLEFVKDFNAFMPPVDNGSSGRRRKVVEKEKKEYPPPISPWTMKKFSTSDGRVVIQEVKVKGQEYFEAHKTNGRLILNLVTEIDEHAVVTVAASSPVHI